MLAEVVMTGVTHGYRGRGMTYCGLHQAKDGRKVTAHGTVTCKRCVRAINAKGRKR